MKMSKAATVAQENHNKDQAVGAKETVDVMVTVAEKRDETKRTEQQRRNRVARSKESAEKKVVRVSNRLAKDARMQKAEIEGRKQQARALRKPLIEIRDENRAGRNPRALLPEQMETENDCNQQLCALNLIIQSSDGFPPEQDPLA
jgi:hypothetical protein